MILPPVAEIQSFAGAKSLRVADWFRSILENDPYEIVEALGSGARELLIIEREKYDRSQRVAHLRDAHPEMTGADVAKVFGAGGL